MSSINFLYELKQFTQFKYRKVNSFPHHVASSSARFLYTYCPCFAHTFSQFLYAQTAYQCLTCTFTQCFICAMLVCSCTVPGFYGGLLFLSADPQLIEWLSSTVRPIPTKNQSECHFQN